MNNILIIDLALLVVFSLGVALFLFKNKKNLKREGLIYLYRTKMGLEAIDKFSKKHSNFLRKTKYFVIVIAFLLMISIIILLASNAYAYLKTPALVIEATNGAPPLAPLIPYFPQIFGMESFFPNFYFSYFLIALAIVAVFHEFAHGVYMKTFGVKIKSTGFLFLGPILGAFVEEDRNNLENKKNSEQMAILGAGVFANILLAIFFFLLLLLFFNISYVPAGYIFSDYVQTGINTSSIRSFQNYSDNLVLVETSNKSYFIPVELYNHIFNNSELLQDRIMIVYEYLPAIRNELRGAIIEIDGKKINSLKEFQWEISKKSPGDNVLFKTIYKEDNLIFNITLEEHPDNSNQAFLGVFNFHRPRITNVRSLIYSILFFRDRSIFYEARLDEELTEFIYYLIWWIALINLFVGLFNMLPLGILDGGRFSYLLILSILKSEKKAKKIYKLIMSTVGVIFLTIIFAWMFARFF